MARRHRHKNEVQLAAFELRFDRGAVVLDERKAHRRLDQIEAADQLRNVPRAQRAQEPERYGAPVGRLEIRELAAAVVDLAERALHPRQEQLARLGQADRTAGAPEQLHAEIGLQPRQRAAQRRLAGAELLGGAGDVLQPSGNPEAFEQVPVGPVHPAGLSNSCVMIYISDKSVLDNMNTPAVSSPGHDFPGPIRLGVKKPRRNRNCAPHSGTWLAPDKRPTNVGHPYGLNPRNRTTAMHEVGDRMHWHEPTGLDRAGFGKFGRPTTPYDQFMESEGIPVFRDVGFEERVRSADEALEAPRRQRHLRPAPRHRRQMGLLRRRDSGRRRAQSREAHLRGDLSRRRGPRHDRSVARRRNQEARVRVAEGLAVLDPGQRHASAGQRQLVARGADRRHDRRRT